MEHILVANDISISFGGVKAVQHVNFGIKKGEILGLIGPNGSGKSTIVNLISGVYRLDTGNITFDGQVIPQNEGIAQRARRGMGRTFQTPKPFSALSVYENVYIIALQKHSPKEAAVKAEKILTDTKLINLAEMQSSKLPIEKRKWLDLARILVNDPTFLMLDEVMAGLNPSEMDESLDLVLDINKKTGVTVLFIEHVMRAVLKICTNCVVLNEGKLLAEGPALEVLERPDVMAAYLGKVDD